MERRMWMGHRRVAPEPTPAQKFMLKELQTKEKDKTAPWSKPRGYDTTLREEAYAFKAAMREMRRQEKEAADIKKRQGAPATMPQKRLKKTRSWHLRQLLPPISDLHIKEWFTRCVGTIFCMRAETEAYIQGQKS